MSGERRLLVGLIATALIAGGCANAASLDFGTPVNMHVSTTPTSVELDAPGWLADISAVYLCPTEPARLPDNVAERVNWTPGPDCEFMGSYPGRDGMKLSMPLSAIHAERRPKFDAAPDWWVVLLDLDGDRVSAAVNSQFHAPPVASVPSS